MDSPKRSAPVRRPTRSNSEITEEIITREEAIFIEVLNAIDTHKTQAGKIKSEGVKEAVGVTIKKMIEYRRVRDALHSDFQTRIRAAVVKAGVKKTAERVEAFEAKVLEALSQVTEELAEQDAVLSKLSKPVTHTQPDEPKWTEVLRRPKKVVAGRRTEAPVVDMADENQNGSGNGRRLTKHLRTRPLAIMVSKGEECFPELLKTV